jgi:transcriptional regulator with XRE-family HTH domain
MNAAALRTRQNGAAIRALRRKDGQSVRELAEAAGLGEQPLRNIENGFRQASWEALARIAKALSVPVAAIVNDRALDELPSGAPGEPDGAVA